MKKNKNKMLNYEIMKELVGKTAKEGELLCSQNGYKCRIVREDKVRHIVTMDYRLDRINIRLDNDIITSCDMG